MLMKPAEVAKCRADLNKLIGITLILKPDFWSLTSQFPLKWDLKSMQSHNGSLGTRVETIFFAKITWQLRSKSQGTVRSGRTSTVRYVVILPVLPEAGGSARYHLPCHVIFTKIFVLTLMGTTLQSPLLWLYNTLKWIVLSSKVKRWVYLPSSAIQAVDV